MMLNCVLQLSFFQVGQKTNKVINYENIKIARQTTGDVGFKPSGLKLKGKAAITSK